MLAALEASVTRERTFSRESSHELKMPITIAKGHLELLTPEASPDELLGTLAVVLNELDRMTRIVDDMTDIAYMGDPASLRRAETRIGRFVAELASKATPLLNSRLRVEPVAERGTLRADAQRLTQALINLQPFYTGRASSGSGLGLSIVAAHGGTAWIENRRGQGATFWLRIPR